MEILIRGDKVDATKAISDYAKEKLSKLDKYIDNADNVKATVFMKIRNHSQKVEVTIPLKKLILRAEEEREDVYAAIDVVVDKIERQIRKNKTKLAKRNKDVKEIVLDIIEEEDDDNSSKIVKRKKIDVKPMSEEEAIIQMELLGHNFYLFKDSNTLNPTLIYKRTDGDYGIIETD